MNSPQEDTISLEMPARLWAGIDAGVDNAVSLYTLIA